MKAGTKIQWVKIGQVKPNPDNPRVIKDDKFAKLVKSIQEFPKMLEIRPIVVNEDMVILGGNMRLKACKEAGLKEIPIIVAEGLTEEEQREFVIKDNVNFGEWDLEDLLQGWGDVDLGEWGLDLDIGETKEGHSGKEIDVSQFGSEMTLNLKYSEERYKKIREQLEAISKNPADAVWKLLGNE